MKLLAIFCFMDCLAAAKAYCYCRVAIDADADYGHESLRLNEVLTDRCMNNCSSGDDEYCFDIQMDDFSVEFQHGDDRLRVEGSRLLYEGCDKVLGYQCLNEIAPGTGPYCQQKNFWSKPVGADMWTAERHTRRCCKGSNCGQHDPCL